MLKFLGDLIGNCQGLERVNRECSSTRGEEASEEGARQKSTVPECQFFFTLKKRISILSAE